MKEPKTEEERKWVNYINEYGVRNGDVESAHSEAHKALVLFLTSLGYHALVEAWESVKKWYA